VFSRGRGEGRRSCQERSIRGLYFSHISRIQAQHVGALPRAEREQNQDKTRKKNGELNVGYFLWPCLVWLTSISLMFHWLELVTWPHLPAKEEETVVHLHAKKEDKQLLVNS
jgi:hypothetical protein